MAKRVRLEIFLNDEQVAVAKRIAAEKNAEFPTGGAAKPWTWREYLTVTAQMAINEACPSRPVMANSGKA